MVLGWLDGHRVVLGWVAADLGSWHRAATGRKGLSAESVLRCALLKQYRQLSYDDLAFCLLDSMSCRTFARLSTGWVPKKAALQEGVSTISCSTWERINQHLLRDAKVTRVERGEMLRIDSTVTDAPIHEPTDSSLLGDSMRVVVRLLEEAATLAEGVTAIAYCNHQRMAKKRVRAIFIREVRIRNGGCIRT